MWVWRVNGGDWETGMSERGHSYPELCHEDRSSSSLSSPCTTRLPQACRRPPCATRASRCVCSGEQRGWAGDGRQSQCCAPLFFSLFKATRAVSIFVCQPAPPRLLLTTRAPVLAPIISPSRNWTPWTRAWPRRPRRPPTPAACRLRPATNSSRPRRRRGPTCPLPGRRHPPPGRPVHPPQCVGLASWVGLVAVAVAPWTRPRRPGGRKAAAAPSTTTAAFLVPPATATTPRPAPPRAPAASG